MDATVKALGGTKADLDFEPPMEAGLHPIKEVLRTPDSRFEGLKDFPFAPHYFDTRSHANLRMHYIDEGPRGAAETIVLMHGEPSWCYLYRHMIPPLVQAGYRVLAPDLIGFGKSDKPVARDDYSYERHVDWVSEWLVGVGVYGATLFAQDWGGLVGLRVVARYPERFARVCISNTTLPTGKGVGTGFREWAGVVSQKIRDWRPILQGGSQRKLSKAELDAYAAPFPDEQYKAGSRQFPRLVPQFKTHASVEENQGAIRRVYQRWQKPFLTLFGANDPMSKGGDRMWHKMVPGAKGMKHTIIDGAGHFCQEDKPLELTQHIIQLINDHPQLPQGPPVAAKL